MTNYLAGWSGIWKKNDWRIGFKEICERSFCMNLYEWKKNWIYFLFHVNGHHRVISARGRFWQSNGYGTTCLMDTKKPFSSLFYHHNGLINKVAMVTRMEFLYRLSNGLPPTKASLANDIVECPVCQQWKATVSPWYGTISASRLITVVCFHPFPSWKGNILLSLDKTLILDTDLPFL